MLAARDELQASGIEFDIANGRRYIAEPCLPIFERDIAGILATITA